MHTWILINPQAGQAEAATAVQQWVDARPQVVCRESADANACRRLVRDALAAGAERVVAAGGDGTMNTVVNALRELEADVVLGLLPLGTGNDLARTLAIPRALDDALEVLDEGRTARIDLFQLTAPGISRYGANVAAGGFSGQVDEALTGDVKAHWGPLAYLRGAAQVLPEMQQYETTVAFDDGPRERVNAFNIVVANGRTAAGGHRVAPEADPCDGQLDVVIVQWGSAAALTEVGARLMAGNYTRSELVTHLRVQQVAVASSPGMWFNVDGELVTNEPVTIRVLPACQQVVVGPDFICAASE